MFLRYFRPFIADSSSQTTISKKKKKKKNKNGTAVGSNDKVNSPALGPRNSHANDYPNVEPARILHNPSTNMVTIRNPAFGPPPPKMESCPNQAAIIKVGDNGMVTIRSPALQQAINMGLTPPPKPDFVVKGDANSHEPAKVNIQTRPYQQNRKKYRKIFINPFLTAESEQLREQQ